MGRALHVELLSRMNHKYDRLDIPCIDVSLHSVVRYLVEQPFFNLLCT